MNDEQYKAFVRIVRTEIGNAFTLFGVPLTLTSAGVMLLASNSGSAAVHEVSAVCIIMSTIGISCLLAAAILRIISKQ